MKQALSGKNKIQEICDLLKNETLEPAHQEAKEIVENAHLEAEEIKKRAKEEADHLISMATKQIDQKKQAFDAALALAAKQAIEALKQQIQLQLFDQELAELTSKTKVDEKLVARLIEVVIDAVEKSGLDSEIGVFVGKNMDPRQMSEFISKRIIDRIKDHKVALGGFANGMQVKLLKSNITLDFSEKALKDLISQFVRKDFREFFFQK